MAIVEDNKEDSNIILDDLFEGSNESLEETIPTQEVALEDDEILSLEIDQEELAKHEAELYLPKGVYIWDTKPNIRKSYNDNDKSPSDMAQRLYKVTGNFKHNLGRCFINISGVVINKETKKKGRFQFSFSPDYRKDTRDTGMGDEGDMASKQYVNLTTFYFNQYEKKIKTPLDICNMLLECNYEMYITLSKAGTANYLGRIQKLK